MLRCSPAASTADAAAEVAGTDRAHVVDVARRVGRALSRRRPRPWWHHAILAAGADPAVRRGAADRAAHDDGWLGTRRGQQVSLADADAGLRSAEEVRWARKVTAELANLRAAYRWAVDNDIDVAARITGSLDRYARRVTGHPRSSTGPSLSSREAIRSLRCRWRARVRRPPLAPTAAAIRTPPAASHSAASTYPPRPANRSPPGSPGRH